MYHWFEKGVKMSGNAERKGLEEQEFVNGNLLNLYHQKDFLWRKWVTLR